MKFTVYNFKGGQGKTVISANLALTLDFAVVTNDYYSPIDTLLPPERVLKLTPADHLPVFDENYSIIFDLGGYIDERAISALEQSKYVLVPVLNEFKALQTTIHTIEEIAKYNSNILIIANSVQKNDLSVIRNVVENTLPDLKLKVLPIKRSTALDTVFELKTSIKDIVYKGGSLGYHFSPVAKQFDAIINHIIR